MKSLSLRIAERVAVSTDASIGDKNARRIYHAESRDPKRYGSRMLDFKNMGGATR